MTESMNESILLDTYNKSNNAILLKIINDKKTKQIKEKKEKEILFKAKKIKMTKIKMKKKFNIIFLI